MSEGFSKTLRKTQKHDPSLTQRVGMAANAQLQNASARDLRKYWQNATAQSLTNLSGCDGRQSRHFEAGAFGWAVNDEVRAMLF